MAFVSTIKLRVDQKGFKEACVLTGHLNVPKILELAPNKYFIELDKDPQEEIIARTGEESFCG